MLTATLRFLFFFLLVRPFVFIFLGPYVRDRQRLPKQGPAIIVANHNSHLDTAVIMSLFPLGEMLRLVRPVAAADYWLKNKAIAYFALRIVGVIPIRRRRDDGGVNSDPFATLSQALDAGKIVIYYPEGTRGEPEQMEAFKSGISRLAERHPNVPVVPIFLQGTGKALPRGEGLIVPFVCDAYIGESISWDAVRDSGAKFHHLLETKIQDQARRAHVLAWD